MDNTKEQAEEQLRFAAAQLAERIESIRTGIQGGYARSDEYRELREKEGQLLGLYGDKVTPDVASLSFTVKKLAPGGEHGTGLITRYTVQLNNPTASPEANGVLPINLIPKSWSQEKIANLPYGGISTPIRPK